MGCLRGVWLSALFAGALAAQAEWLDPVQQAEIDRVFAAYANGDSPGYALGIIKNGSLAFARGYGQANLDDHVPITADTAFHLASVSKQFTAAAVALLILDGKLSLTDAVSKYIPEAAKYGDGLRIEHLVYMTSGLREYTDLPRKSGAPWMAFYYFTRDEAIHASLEPAQLDFAPGSQWAYRNVNYMLLTRIVEAVSHQSFADYMQHAIFLPLKMTHTLIDDDTTEVIPNRATGYAPRSDPRVVKELADAGVKIHPGDGWVRLVRVSPHFGGSGVFTTLNDLLLWDRNWYSGALGGRAFVELMNQRRKFEHPKDNDAFGLVWRKLFDRPLLDYSGGDTDASTYMARFPEDRLTVICLSNMPLGDAEGKAHSVLDLLHRWGKL
jgi:CubicO group peptidase (beta-lactamase class C family)